RGCPAATCCCRAQVRWWRPSSRTCAERPLRGRAIARSLRAREGDLDHLRVVLADREVVDLEHELVVADEAHDVLDHLVVLARHRLLPAAGADGVVARPGGSGAGGGG